ncbi:MAG: FtsX-like permease family protein [Bryobacteraceae bacterium]
MFTQIHQHFQTIEHSALLRTRPVTILGPEGPESTYGQALAGGGLHVFGTAPAIGRLFQLTAANEVVLSHRIWMRRYLGDPGIVGRVIRLNGEGFTVVGVMPPGFETTNRAFELWLPWRFSAELAGFAGTDGWQATLAPLKERRVGQYRHALWVLLGAVGFVMAIARLNAACLFLTRAQDRRKELAVRCALGAPRSRLIRQFLLESMMLASAGGLLGLLLASWGTSAMIALASDRQILPRLTEANLDYAVLAFHLAITVAAGMALGLFTGWRASSLDVGALKETGRGATGIRGVRLARGLAVVLQVSLSLVLLAGAGLLIRSFANLLRTDPGFRPEGILTARVPSGTGQGNEIHLAVRYASILEVTRAMPGVEAAAISTVIPMGPVEATVTLMADSGENPAGRLENVQYRAVSAGYFDVMRIPILRGRAFDDSDTHGAAEVAIINDVAAKKYWPGEDPIGRRLATSFDDGRPRWMTVVGVVGGVRQRLRSEPKEEIYRPYTQHLFGAHGAVLVLRTAQAPGTLVEPLRSVLRKTFPDQPVADIRAMEEWVGQSYLRPRFDAVLLGLFAVVALVIAATGIYAQVAYEVRRRWREIGIRLSLGATDRDVFRMVVRRTVWLVVPGLILGMAGAMALTRLLSAQLYGISPHDPLSLAAAGGILFAAGMAASWGPARRAAGIQPWKTLRDE